MLVDIANEQAKADDVTVIVVNDSYQPSLLDQFDKGVKLVLLHRKPGKRGIVPFLRLNLILLRMRPDAVHVHSASLLPVILPKAGHGLFYTVHALNIPMGYSEHVTCMFAISDAVREDMRSRCRCPIVTVPNGIAANKIKVRGKSGLDCGLKIVEVARLDAENKGQDILIEAVAKLRDRGLDNIFVDFIGQGNSLGALQQRVSERGLDDRIRFLGLQSRAYIYAHLCDYDLLCHPARYEGFGLTVAEGMAAGVPVLVSDEGGPFEIIRKGEYGNFFHNGDIDDCASQIARIYEDYAAALNRVETARWYVMENYSVEKMVASYRKQYEKALSKRK